MTAIPESQRAIDLAALRTGDPDALAQVYGAYGAAVYRVAYRITGSRAEAEDVTQDVFVGLPEAVSRYEERGTFGGWLQRIAVRTALMRLRANRRLREISLDAAAQLSVSEKDRAETSELEAAVAGLPDRLRLVLILRETEGLSHAEIAALLGITAQTSRVRLLRAFRRLRQTLGGSP